MKRLAVLVLTIAGVIGVVPATSGALPPGVVPGPNSITGTVTDQNGQPVANVFIIDTTFTFSTSTDVDGTYLLDGLTAGTEYTVIAADQTGQYPEARSNPVVVSDTSTVVVDFALQPFPTSGIRGTVTDQNGVPLAGITVSDALGAGFASTAADGTYAIDGLRLDSTHFFGADDRSGLHQRADSGEITVAADGSTVVDFILQENVLSVVGTVTDPTGAPVPNAIVEIAGFFGFRVFTGPDGRFGFAAGTLPEGDVTLQISPGFSRPDLRPTGLPVTVAAGTTVDASVQLTRAASIDVTVTAGGLPANARVRLWSGLPFGGVVRSLTVGPDGTVSLPILNDGEYYLEIESQTIEFASEFYPDRVLRADAQRFTIAGEQHIPVAVDLERAATISGTITNSDGTPGDFTQVAPLPVGVPEDQIFAIPHCNVPQPDDPPGTFRVGCLHPSVDWVLKGFGFGASDHGYYLDSQSSFNATPIAVEPGQAVTGIDIQLKPKSPNPTITRVSQQFFRTGTTTAGVHVFGTNFPSDPHAIHLDTDASAFFFPDVHFTVTSVVSPNELIATVVVDPAEIGPFPAIQPLTMSTSIGGGFDGGPALLFGDATTPVASVSGRVTDSRGRGIANTSVVVRETVAGDFGSFRQISTVTGPDGRWTAQGVSPGTYTVQFEGSEAFNGQFWKQRTTQTAATPITLKNGDVRTGINATLTARGPIKVFAASPKLQVPNLSFDLVGQGLGSIRGGFRVSIATAFGNFPLQTQPVSSTRLHVTGFAFPGTWDIVTEWTGDDGTVKSTTCVACIKVYDDLSAFSFDNFIAPGNTAAITYFGQGLVDITKVTVGGRDVRVLSYRTFDGGNIEITFAVKNGAAPGSRPVTITRIDGRSTTTDVVVGSPF